MRTFAKMNTSNGETCLVCDTQKEGEVVLVGIAGTQDDGIIEAKQFHLSCIELLYDRQNGFIYQFLRPKDSTK